MIKSKDRKLYDIKLEMYSSGRVQGKVSGRGYNNSGKRAASMVHIK